MTPSHSRRSHAGRPLTVIPGLLATLLWIHGDAVQAQAVPSASPAASEITPLERAKRDAEKVFRWIRMHSDKPRRVAPPQANSERAAVAAPVAVRAAAPRATHAKSLDDESAPPPSAAAEKAEKAMQLADTAASQAAPAAAPAQPAGAAVAATSDSAAPIATLPVAPLVEEDVPLVALVKTEPEFPTHLMRQLRKGTVQVAFTVQPDGSVAQARSLASTHPRLVQTAVATVAQWRFQPLHHAQQAVVELGFDLE